MAIILDPVVDSTLSRPCASTARSSSHENLITDELIARALQAILDVCDADGRMKARAMREKAGFTLTEAIQLLVYLRRQDALGDEVDGQRVVNRALASEYLSILSPSEEPPVQEEPKEERSFSRAHIAWACMHARDNNLTPMRVARPSRWTIGLARALSLALSDTPGALLLPTSRAKRLCGLVRDMSEVERTPYIRWAETRLPADGKVGAGERSG